MNVNLNDLFVKDEILDIEEQKLISNMTVYRELLGCMKIIQPSLRINDELIENICWVIYNLETIKDLGFAHEYYLHWFKDLLRVTTIRFDGKIFVIFIKLEQGKLFHDNDNNIRFVELPGKVII